MQRFLIDHAIANAWCNPQQDNQVVIAAKRLTRNNGELNRVTVMNRQFLLPESGKRYHVYQIGQILPVALGFKPGSGDWEPQRWIKFSDAMVDQKLIANLYTGTGINIPRFSTYYMFTNDRDLIFAVEIDTVVPINFNVDTLYLRLYSNAYYQSSQGDAVADYVVCNGKKITNMQKILDLQAEVNSYRPKIGSISCYVNGIQVEDISPLTAKVYDCVEYVYDSSVKRIVTFDVSSLPTFNSTLDNKHKYLLHYLNSSIDTIEYQDDIDIYIVHTASNGKKSGVYYHRNLESSHRMVTHRDYSIVVDFYDHIATALVDLLALPGFDIRTLKLEVTIRNSGYLRPLIFDNSRIFELYKLSDENIVKAMVGVMSSLQLWRAEVLEANAYTALMRARVPTITLEMVQNAYGYNAMSKIVGDTPSKTTLDSSRQTAPLPLALVENATVYEYDVNGYLLGFHHSVINTNYYATNNDTKLIEALSGKGSHRPDTVFGTDNLPLPEIDNYRVYMCFLNNGVPNENWRDITGSELYTVENNVLKWTNLQIGQFLVVRTDSTFLAYDVDVSSVDGTISLVVTQEEDRGNGYQLYPMNVPRGELDLFMNGRSLIKGLDYIVKFPKIHIVNRTHLIQPASTSVQKVHVRFTGFCKDDLSFEAIDDYGFIQHGYLSNNNRFDIRDDKVLRITVDGATIHREDLLYSEEHDGVSIVNPDNGKPYQVKDVIVPLKQLVDENTYSLRDKSILIDEAVSNYMTVKLPQPSRGDLMAIPSYYPVVSTFFSRIINALQDLEIPTSVVVSGLSDNGVLEVCAPFEHLLEFDPINPANGYDFKFVEAAPHRLNAVINLTLPQYRLLARIVKLYGHDLIDITSYVNFST